MNTTHPSDRPNPRLTPALSGVVLNTPLTANECAFHNGFVDRTLGLYGISPTYPNIDDVPLEGKKNARMIAAYRLGFFFATSEKKG